MGVMFEASKLLFPVESFIPDAPVKGIEKLPSHQHYIVILYHLGYKVYMKLLMQSESERRTRLKAWSHTHTSYELLDSGLTKELPVDI